MATVDERIEVCLFCGAGDDEEHTDAADCIESLAKRLQAERDRREELEVALEPFAAVEEWIEYEPMMAGADELVCSGCYASVAVNHGDPDNQAPVEHDDDCPLVRARQALKGETRE